MPFEQLRRAAQSAEGILDLMRKLANHRTTATELGQQRIFARHALVMRRVGKLDDDTARASGRIERRHRGSRARGVVHPVRPRTGSRDANTVRPQLALD